MRPYRSLHACLARLAVAVFCASFALAPVSTAQGGDPAKPYLGMTQDEIVACAGEPRSRYPSGAQAETFVYHYSGNGPVPGEPDKSAEKKKDKPGFFSSDKKKKEDKSWTCTASLVFENGRLARVAFAHKDARSPYAWQSERNPEKAEKLRNEEVPTCNFSLPRCSPAQ
jgi:hypothetical protein